MLNIRITEWRVQIFICVHKTLRFCILTLTCYSQFMRSDHLGNVLEYVCSRLYVKECNKFTVLPVALLLFHIYYFCKLPKWYISLWENPKGYDMKWELTPLPSHLILVKLCNWKLLLLMASSDYPSARFSMHSFFYFPIFLFFSLFKNLNTLRAPFYIGIERITKFSLIFLIMCINILLVFLLTGSWTVFNFY